MPTNADHRVAMVPGRCPMVPPGLNGRYINLSTALEP